MTSIRTVFLLAVLFVSGPVLAHGPEEHEGHGGHKAVAAFGEPGDPSAPARTIEVSMREGDGKMLFEPDVVTVAKGEQVRFHLKNDGELDHEFFLGTPEEIDEHADMMKAMPDMKHDDPFAQRFSPKASGSIVVRFTASGEFEFACLIPGHLEAGMKGKIIVK